MKIFIEGVGEVELDQKTMWRVYDEQSRLFRIEDARFQMEQYLEGCGLDPEKQIAGHEAEWEALLEEMADCFYRNEDASEAENDTWEYVIGEVTKDVDWLAV